MAIQIWRGGITSRYVKPETTSVTVEKHAGNDYGVEAVKVRFYLDSKGGGVTAVNVLFPPEDFAHLAATMLRVDPVAAIRAFGSAMVNGMGPD